MLFRLFLMLSILYRYQCQIYAQDLSLVALLPTSINESSGLIHLNGKLITHLDSDNPNALFEIDTTDGTIIRTVYITNASNIDWEDICYDDDFIYIGDFGNNSGSRTNLRIYKVAILDYLTSTNDSILADTLSYSYSNQVDFTSGSNNTNFDAEAMISFGDSLYIFSKNWLNNTCDIYALSKNPGNSSIAKIDSFNSEGLITGASYLNSSNELFLCGYGPPIPFVIQINNFTGFPLSANQINHQMVQVPTGSSVQIEAITHKDSETLYISSESSVLGSSALFTLQKSSLVGLHDIQKSIRTLYPNPSTSILHVDKHIDEYIELYNAGGQLISSTFKSSFSTTFLDPGFYQVLIRDSKHHIISRKSLIIKDQ